MDGVDAVLLKIIDGNDGLVFQWELWLVCA